MDQEFYGFSDTGSVTVLNPHQGEKEEFKEESTTSKKEEMLRVKNLSESSSLPDNDTNLKTEETEDYKQIELKDTPPATSSKCRILDKTVGKVISIGDDKIVAIIKINGQDKTFFLSPRAQSRYDLNQGDVFTIEAIEYNSYKGKTFPRITKLPETIFPAEEFPPVNWSEFKKHQI